MSGRTRQTILLIALAAALLTAARQWIRPLGLGRENTATVSIAPHRQAGRAGIRSGDRIASLNTVDLERVRSGGLGGRDPWRFVDPAPIHTLRAGTQGPVVQPAAQPEPSAPAPPGPHPEEFNLRYLGRFGPPDKQIAVFTSGARVFNLQEGEVIDGKFIVARIGYESVDIRFVGFPDVPAKRVVVKPRTPGGGG